MINWKNDFLQNNKFFITRCVWSMNRTGKSDSIDCEDKGFSFLLSFKMCVFFGRIGDE